MCDWRVNLLRNKCASVKELVGNANALPPFNFYTRALDSNFKNAKMD